MFSQRCSKLGIKTVDSRGWICVDYYFLFDIRIDKFL
ncbi:hypothetical protein AG1IA_08179 [Rhizoctonia solani AG-1 IA]|uniref:Uncharacterized protein n=1 Tax=Thanatephorus cucumeris (strain AG1-IA) TaxID=983506 RepID=L8WHX8_THACA|nr:hypothetical protein AG1IA_08179 [Rhizoctonia solani AG-1 IA]